MIDDDLGELTHDEDFECPSTAPLPVPFLDGKPCRFVLTGFEDDPKPHEVIAAVRRTLAASKQILLDAEPYVARYCDEICALYDELDSPLVLEQPSDVWAHVYFGDVFYVSRRSRGDDEDGIYLSLECACDWEEEHGLLLVIRDGVAVSKVGPYDGHRTNSDAFNDRRLAHVIFRSFK